MATLPMQHNTQHTTMPDTDLCNIYARAAEWSGTHSSSATYSAMLPRFTMPYTSLTRSWVVCKLIHSVTTKSSLWHVCALARAIFLCVNATYAKYGKRNNADNRTGNGVFDQLKGSRQWLPCAQWHTCTTDHCIMARLYRIRHAVGPWANIWINVFLSLILYKCFPSQKMELFLLALYYVIMSRCMAIFH